MTDLTGFNLKKQIYLFVKSKLHFTEESKSCCCFFFMEENDKKRPLGSAKAAALSF